LELHAAGILAALAVVTFASQVRGGAPLYLALLAAFAGTAFASARFAQLDTTTLGFGVVAAATAALMRPHWRLLPPVAAGVFAAAWISVLEAQGLPWLPAAVAAAGVLSVATGLALWRREFAPPDLVDEALVLVTSFALLLAVGPDIVAGWRSGSALAAEPLTVAEPNASPWLAALVIGAMLLGGLYTAWKRR
jgi:hypothetical protein